MKKALLIAFLAAASVSGIAAQWGGRGTAVLADTKQNCTLEYDSAKRIMRISNKNKETYTIEYVSDTGVGSQTVVLEGQSVWEKPMGRQAPPLPVIRKVTKGGTFTGTGSWTLVSAAPSPAAPADPVTPADPTPPVAPATPVTPAAPAAPAAPSPDWNMSVVNTAASADYLSATEKDIILEMNKARTNPKQYAELYIKPRLERFRGKTYQEPGKTALATAEGANAVQDCYDRLMKAAPLPPFTPSRGMSLAAKDHVKDQGATTTTGHYGKDRSDPFDRMNRYGAWDGSAGENISYGSTGAQEVVIQLLVDDGVPDRGHYVNIMDASYRIVGVAAGPHRAYGAMAVIDFAGSYRER
ncbi:hypothetical protein FACS189461_1040 [Spirochaetia bacterium]|nr:hypothetical protein FACS189461_1040 [Spirochaetia bacterium]